MAGNNRNICRVVDSADPTSCRILTTTAGDIPMKTENISVPYAMSVHTQKEVYAVMDVLKTGTIMGEHTRLLESRIAESFDKKHGVMVNSGTSALFLTMESLGLPAGAEVITPALTFSSTVSCIVKNGFKPVFVDAAPDTFCADTGQIADMLTDKTRALLLPNLVGNICEWGKIADMRGDSNVLLIEDCADTLGATLQGKSSGHWSDASITSFYGSHIINGAGNGGMLCVNDDSVAERALLLRSWGRRSSLFGRHEGEQIANRFNVEIDGIPYDAKFIFSEMGYQLESSEISAAFALAQLDNLENNIKARIDNFNKQDEFFGKWEEFFVRPRPTPNSRSGWLAYPLTIRESAPFDRRDFQIYLEERKIQTRPVFAGNILRQPGFCAIDAKTRPGGYPVADNVMKNGVLLACHHGLTDEMLAHIHQTITDFIGQSA